MGRPSIYELAGGHDAFLAFATAVTERCIADPELNHAFSHGLSPRHNENLAAYWEEVFGGPRGYSNNLGGHSGMLTIHAAQGAPDEWGDRFEALLHRGDGRCRAAQRSGVSEGSSRLYPLGDTRGQPILARRLNG